MKPKVRPQVGLGFGTVFCSPSPLVLLLVIFLEIACGASQESLATPVEGPTPAVTPELETEIENDSVEADAPLEWQTPAAGMLRYEGAEMTIPPGFVVAEDARGLHLRSRDQGMQLSMMHRTLAAPLDPSDDASIVSLIVDAWQTVDPSFNNAMMYVARLHDDIPWDLMAQVMFQTTPGEERVLVAFVLVLGTEAYITIQDSSDHREALRSESATALLNSLRIDGLGPTSYTDIEPLPLTEDALAQMSLRIDAMRRQEQIPGAAVAIVRGTEVLLQQGYGIRARNAPQRVDEQTLFMLGSVTTSFTSLLAARLVDQGRLAWHSTLTGLLPDISFGDTDFAQSMELRHAFCACVSVVNRDLAPLFEPSRTTPEDWLGALGSLNPRLRETGYAFSKRLVVVGGYAMAREIHSRLPLNVGFSRLLRQQVLIPLGMTRTTLSIRQAVRTNHAEPHVPSLDGTLRRLPATIERGVEGAAPVSGLWSNLSDMTRLIQMELQNGNTRGGRRFISASALQERRQPGVVLSGSASYGLGLTVYDHRGIQGFGNLGHTAGFTADMLFFPTLDLGLVVLANIGDATAFTIGIRSILLETVLGLEPRAERVADTKRRRYRTAIEQIRQQIRSPTQDESAPLLGTYRAEDLGEITIRRQGGDLVLDAGEWMSKLAFLADPDGGGHIWLFADPPLTGRMLLHEGDALRLRVPPDDYVFERVPPH